MRITRSRNPDGPYVDIRGRDVTNSNPTGANSVGNKLAGNYRFEGTPRGYAALGHNSILVEDGKYFNIYHTRYQQGENGVTGNHNQFVNQMFFNDEGWAVMAPNRYAGESAGRVTIRDVLGDFDVVIHTSVRNDVTFAHSVVYTLTANGEVRARQNNTVAGSWQRKGDYYFAITINGTEYNGVMVPQYNSDRGYAELSFTGISSAGVSMWANKIPGTAPLYDNLYISDVTLTRIEITNPTNSAITTKGLYLSNNDEDLLMWQMPSLIIPAGVTVVIRFDDNPRLKHTKTNFNFNPFNSNPADNVYLTDARENVLENFNN